MPFNSLLTRANNDPLFSDVVEQDIIQPLLEQSIVMRAGTRGRDMLNNQTEYRVLDTFPQAFFGDGDTAMAQTTQMQWKNVFMRAAKIHVIVPIPEDVIDDADFDVWAEIQPRLVEAFGLKIDRTVLFASADKPPQWPDAIVTGATAAGNTVALGTGSDLYDDLLDEAGAFSIVEQDGFDITGSITTSAMKGRLRGVRGTDGHPIFYSSAALDSQDVLNGQPVYYVKRQAFDTSAAHLITGAWDQLLYSFRHDIRFKVSDTAVLNDAANNTTMNSFQQDIVMLKATMRWGWAIPNPVNYDNQTEATRYPFSVLTP